MVYNMVLPLLLPRNLILLNHKRKLMNPLINRYDGYRDFIIKNAKYKNKPSSYELGFLISQKFHDGDL